VNQKTYAFGHWIQDWREGRARAVREQRLDSAIVNAHSAALNLERLQLNLARAERAVAAAQVALQLAYHRAGEERSS